MSNPSKTLLALLGGLAAGAILGILFAPEKGSETRKKISDQAQKLGDKAKAKFRTGMKNQGAGVDRMEEEMEEML
ncbi:MAG: YtxH domain-containing protein [Bacteroidia bacterium]|nr:YtxH domain-containing protein [Bacteroidia bacterium]